MSSVEGVIMGAVSFFVGYVIGSALCILISVYVIEPRADKG